MRRTAITILVFVSAVVPLLSQNTPTANVGGPAAILTADDVRAILNVAATALDSSTMAVAVVDRNGAILGVYVRPDAAEQTPDIAVSLARTGAFFSNDQAPLSSRTVRFISGIHFPPGVRNTPVAPLYGIENTNRGCAVAPAGQNIFNQPVVLPRSIAGTFGTIPGLPALPCHPGNTSGCARGGPMTDLNGHDLPSVGITTGKSDVLDSGQSDPSTVPVDPGGIPIYRGGKLIGGVGVAGVAPDLAEYAATLAAAGSGRGIDFAEPLGAPGAVFINGIRLPFFSTCPDIPCIRSTLKTLPPGAAPGRFSDGHLIVLPRGGQQAPENYLIGPRGSTTGALTIDDVRRLVDQAVAVALRTRAQIRLPISQPTRMVISISDESGNILAAYRMPDATIFSIDTAITKARNAYYFSTRDGYEVLKSYVESNPYDDYTWEPDPPAGQGWAITARTISFGGQPLFPPGIDLRARPTPGPWFDLFVYDSMHPCTEGPTLGADPGYFNQSGIVWFPGSTPLYKNGQLVGGMGVSGDGVDQDDYVAQIGSDGFHPPDALRVDNSVIRNSKGQVVRLPYAKFPRHPEFGQ